MLNNETIASEVNIGVEKFTITDKRLLYNNGSNNYFVGINELRGAECTVATVDVAKFNFPKGEGRLVLSVLIAFVMGLLYEYFVNGHSFSIVLALFLALPIAIGLLLLTYIIDKATTSKEQKCVLQISKKDNTWFINQYYASNFNAELSLLANNINTQIYS